MSILIKGMEMPKSGVYEISVDNTNGQDKTGMTVYKRKDNGFIHVFGTYELVPVPPHGDLIDRYKLYEKTAEWESQALHMVELTMNDEDTTEWKRWSAVLTERSAFKFDVADAPTIIEAEVDDEDKTM